MQAAVAFQELKDAIATYVRFVKNCPEDRTETLQLLEQMAALTQNVNVEQQPVEANIACSHVVKLNMRVQFDADDYNEAHGFSTKIGLAHAITDKLALLGQSLRPLMRGSDQSALQKFQNYKINAGSLESFIRSRVHAETEDSFLEIKRRQVEIERDQQAQAQALVLALKQTQAKLQTLQQQNSLEMSQIQQGIQFVMAKSGDEREALNGELKFLETQIQNQQARIDEQNALVKQLDQLSQQLQHGQRSHQNKIGALYQTTTQLVESQAGGEQDVVQLYQMVNQMKQEYSMLGTRFTDLQGQYAGMQMSMGKELALSSKVQ